MNVCFDGFLTLKSLRATRQTGNSFVKKYSSTSTHCRWKNDAIPAHSLLIAVKSPNVQQCKRNFTPPFYSPVSSLSTTSTFSRFLHLSTGKAHVAECLYVCLAVCSHFPTFEIHCTNFKIPVQSQHRLHISLQKRHSILSFQRLLKIFAPYKPLWLDFYKRRKVFSK